MPHKPSLLSRINGFLARHDASPSAFGMATIGDPKLYWDIKERGRQIKPHTERHIIAYMKAIDDGKPPPARRRWRNLPISPVAAE